MFPKDGKISASQQMIHSDSSNKLPITAYLNSKHGLLFSKSKSSSLSSDLIVKDVDPLQLQIDTLESQVKSNNTLTVKNTDDLKRSKKAVEILTQRLDSCSSQIDQLTHATRESTNDLKRGQKRKWEEIASVVKEVDQELSNFECKMEDLENSITDLSIKLDEIQMEQKKQKRLWMKSAAVGASAAIVVISSFVFTDF
jgi:chromosome segregation ATPase